MNIIDQLRVIGVNAIWSWLLRHGWEQVIAPRWGAVAIRLGRHCSAVRLTSDATVLGSDVAASLGVATELFVKAVQEDWTYEKLLFESSNGGLT